MRNGSTTDDKQGAQRRDEAERRKQARAERKAAMEAAATSRVAASPPQVTPPLDIEKMLPGGRFDGLSAAMWECLVALFLIIAFFLVCGREIAAAIRVTMRRATPQTADHVFEGVLREKIEKRLSRREADKVRKRRMRNRVAVA